MGSVTAMALALFVVTAVAGAIIYATYRRELKEIRSAIKAGGTIVETAAGPIEYAEAGSGEPVLMIHGAGGGYDQGLLIGRDLTDGHRLIAPSRFGYLRTAVPLEATAAAQADAHVALLDSLRIWKRVVVIGVSAGAPSAIEFALRHPDRASALILLVPRTFDPSNSVGVDNSLASQAVLRLVTRSADFPFWLAMKVARRAVVRFLGVPPALDALATTPVHDRVTEIMRSILPLSERWPGIAVDNSTELSAWPLNRLRLPTLIISARDDLYKTLPGARFTASQIPQAQLEILESGGHLMLGQSARVRSLISNFLERARRSAAFTRHLPMPAATGVAAAE